jgi:hypothetical protein
VFELLITESDLIKIEGAPLFAIKIIMIVTGLNPVEMTLPAASCRVSRRLMILADEAVNKQIRIHPALQAAGNSNLNFSV